MTQKGKKSDEEAKEKFVEEKRKTRHVTMGGGAGKDTEEINQWAPRVWPPPGEHGDGRDQ